MSNIFSINREENGYVHTDLLGGGDAYGTKQKQPKRNNDYGSTGTFSTEYNTSSSEGSSSSNSSNSSQDEGGTSNNNQYQHLSIDISTIDNNSDTSIEDQMIGQHSRDSSYSDLSADGGAGYYDRYARHFRRKDYNIRSYVTNMLTINNFKVIFSGICWWTCYMIMGVFGGSVAYLHFERSDRDIPDPLPDFGYDVIPYFCPAIPHVPHGNVQSIVLFILYALILAGVVLRWKPKYHPKTGEVIWGGDGRLILQHLFHLNCLVFLSRTTTVGLTGLPQPNPKCVEQQHLPVSFGNAMSFVMGRGLVPHACGDLIYSGHVGCTLICMAVLTRHGFLRHKAAAIATWLVAAIGIYFTISCRSHYSVDVMLAFYFGYFLPEWYFNRSDKRVRGTISKLIRRLEVRPEDLRPIDYDDLDDEGVMAKHEIDDEYPTTIAV